MTWVLLGGNGMLGQDLQSVLTEAGATYRALGSSDCDIRDLDAVRAAISDAHVVVNCAAWTAVDKAESHEAEAFAVNATGARNVALAAAESGARLVHISTDYVMAGDASGEYAEDTPQAPRSAYGRTKAAGEWAVRQTNPDALVVRTAWLYGAGGPNFVKTMQRLAGERDTLTVVADQFGQPTWTRDLAELVVSLVARDAPGGYYHGTSQGRTSWHGLAQGVFELSGLNPSRVQAISSDEYPVPAPRPANSVLGHDALRAAGIQSIGPWNERLAVALPIISGDSGQ